MTLEHSTPYDRQFIEEVTVAHRGKNQANEILIPINDFRHGLKILDQDDSLLSYYSVGTIRERIAEYSSQIRNRIEMRLDSGYLLWIRLPDSNPIGPKEIRTLRMFYSDPEFSNIKRYSLFNIPYFVDSIPKFVDPIEVYYFISGPKDCEIRVDRRHTHAYLVDDAGNETDTAPMEYIDRKQNAADFKNDCINIMNPDNYISARFLTRNSRYRLGLRYEIR